MNGLVCLLVFGLLAITALAALGLCRRLFSHEPAPTYGDPCPAGKSTAVGNTMCSTGGTADVDGPRHGADSLVGGRDTGRLAGTGMYSVLQPAQGLLLLPSVGVDENFWKRHRL